MVDSAYILVVVILVGIFMVFVFAQYNGITASSSSNTYKYIKTKDHIISVPHDVLDAILARYRNILIHQCNSEVLINHKKLQKIQKLLASHAKIKYGIEYKLLPNELESYLLDLGVRQSNKYDAELVGGLDVNDSAKSLGIIIWYLERIVMNNKNNPNTIEVPLILEDIDDIASAQPNKKDAYAELRANMPEGTSTELSDPYMSSYNITDKPDYFMSARKYVGIAPKDCSAMLRSNLHNYISDTAAQSVHCENMGAGNVSSKSQNAREAKSNWRHINHSRMADTSHGRDSEFDESDNRYQGPYLSYANYNLSMGLMRREFANRRTNHKQEISDDWGHIENQIFA